MIDLWYTLEKWWTHEDILSKLKTDVERVAYCDDYVKKWLFVWDVSAFPSIPKSNTNEYIELS